MDKRWKALLDSVEIQGKIRPIDMAGIEKAEIDLGLELPCSYKEYVQTFGVGSWHDGLFLSTPTPTTFEAPPSNVVGWIRNNQQVNEATLAIGRTDNPRLYKSLLRFGGNETMWVGWDASDRRGNELAIHAIIDDPSINQHCGYSLYEFLSEWWIGRKLMNVRGFKREESKPLFVSYYE